MQRQCIFVVKYYDYYYISVTLWSHLRLIGPVGSLSLPIFISQTSHVSACVSLCGLSAPVCVADGHA